jgi:hypothetical protein
MRWTKLDLTCIYFFKKLTHHYFKSSPSICSSWIDRVNFFWPNKIHISPTGVVSFLSPPQCRLSSGRCRRTVTLCHVSFSLSQDELTASASSSSNASSRRLLTRAKIEALNPHHRRRPPSPNCLILTLHCYKKIISTLTTLPTTQPRVHLTSSLAIAPHHRSSICHHHRSLSRCPTHIVPLHNDTHGDELAEYLLLLK